MSSPQSSFFSRLKDRMMPGRRQLITLQKRVSELEQQLQARPDPTRRIETLEQRGDQLQLKLQALPDHTHRIETLEQRNDQLQQKLQELPNHASRLDILAAQLAYDRHRIEYLLAAREGVLDDFDSFHRERTTPEYRAAFTAPNPLVSVIVCTANRPELLVNRCLASLQQQTYRNLQIIVVGDHCVDSTPDRVAAIKDDRITFINLKERGPYPPPGGDRWRVAGTYPRNAALSLCEGQFITNLDDDDRYEPDRIEIMVRAAQETQADICWHPFWWEREDGTWFVLGNGKFEEGQIGTSSIFYHRYFARYPADVYAYRLMEPEDWNLLRKIAMLRPRKHFVDRPLVYHYYGAQTEPFTPQEGERFLE